MDPRYRVDILLPLSLLGRGSEDNTLDQSKVDVAKLHADDDCYVYVVQRDLLLMPLLLLLLRCRVRPSDRQEMNTTHSYK
ncbi:hypothetical protein L596_001216 [Steinernema carpocapsae]|uniref:Uncharacterized protein n=1 Tax=Steinernema carpocapsae TaxID=34508 RepID=A0A4U8UKU7_STECR|nr:hypothetical protein L596_001216 [Steinernema carpocapsae]